MGGKVEWTSPPLLSNNDPAGVIKTTLYWFNNKERFLDMHHVMATFTATWVPAPADLAVYSAARAQERLRLEDELKNNVAIISSLRDIAVREFPGVVLSAAANQYFTGQGSVQDLVAIFDLGGLYLDLVPYWATRQGRQIYSRLHNRLNLLPVILIPSEILVPELTAQLARVYLPIREGMEDQAGKLMMNWPADDYDKAIVDVNVIRNRDYTPYVRALDTPDSISGPQPPKGTGLSAATWQTEWEKPTHAFKVLAEWQEYIPTDGVHMEMALSDSVASDEALTDAITRNAP